MSDQNIISPYNINTIQSRQVMGIENIYIYVNYRIINWSNTKFFELTSKGLYQQEVGRITDEILEVKGLWTKEGLPPFVTTEEHPRFWRKFQTKGLQLIMSLYSLWLYFYKPWFQDSHEMHFQSLPRQLLLQTL